MKVEGLKTHRRERNDPSGGLRRWETVCLVAFQMKNHDKQHKLQRICSITSLELLCLDHFAVAMSNLSHDLSRVIRKNCDSQRGGHPSKQRVRAGDYKKRPCGDRKNEIKRNKLFHKKYLDVC